MSFNQEQHTVLKSVNNENIKKVDNFTYLRAWTDNTENDVKVKKALTWKSCNKLNKIWQTPLSKSLKLRTFLALVEFVFLYGNETWTLTKSLEKNMSDGTHTKLLRMVFNVSWSEHSTNSELYGNLPKVSQNIKLGRLKLSGYSLRNPEQIASVLILWQHHKEDRTEGDNERKSGNSGRTKTTDARQKHFERSCHARQKHFERSCQKLLWRLVKLNGIRQVCSLGKLNSKELYHFLILGNYEKPTLQEYFEAFFESTTIDWKDIYLLPSKTKF